jgi:hypothetical protein
MLYFIGALDDPAFPGIVYIAQDVFLTGQENLAVPRIDQELIIVTEIP